MKSLRATPVLVFSLILLAMAACKGKSENTPGDGEIKSYTITGTDGRQTDPAQAMTTENMGRFTLSFDITPARKLGIQILLKSPNSNETDYLYGYCCDGSTGGCSPGSFTCQYISNGTITCGSSTPASVTDFFSRNGGLPNNAQLVLESTTEGCNPDSGIINSRKHSAVRNIIFR